MQRSAVRGSACNRGREALVSSDVARSCLRNGACAYLVRSRVVWEGAVGACVGRSCPLGHASDGHNNELQTVDLNGDGLRDVVIGDQMFDRIQPLPPVLLLNRR